MSREIKCAECKTHMGTIRDALLRTDMVVYCRRCDERLHRILEMSKPGDVPGFLSGLFGGGK